MYFVLRFIKGFDKNVCIVVTIDQFSNIHHLSGVPSADCEGSTNLFIDRVFRQEFPYRC